MTRSYSSFLFWLGLTIAASLMLYHTSDRVTELDQQLRNLNAQIETERESLHVLNAEWVYLSNPARVEAETHRHLDLQPTATRRVVALRDMGSLLPLPNGVEPAPVQVAQTQPAPVKPSPVIAAAVHPVHVASNTTHINDHMTLQHAAPSAPTDKIGALIGTLGLHP